ncbi:class I ribonucleotide reductase maintenance protein YfaE [Acerihabitans sp. TG2]|uniref:class I ribonucleotide reductase maintenance protein YfaE n=1 Tax=Acerihabitans sp. TG2 TaxID=3096008 RepID=UPI002B237B43|nr:class I ribonucleotide reductase maintenance protein YfaE [Acerihabitans sp. TG2]MEA9389177.1 class I ribonucleotide reductase maintenance protein YfaE [Acerihabitans sp. TG2]
MEQPIVSLHFLGTQLACGEGCLSLLEALEAHQVAVESQCRSGYCGACRLRLLSGQVTYRQTPLAFIKPGEILPCCCLPKGNIELAL